MTQFDGELSPVRDRGAGALAGADHLQLAHSGSVYPPEFLNASRIDLAALRRSEDSFMDELIGDLSERAFRPSGQFPPLLCRREPRAL